MKKSIIPLFLLSILFSSCSNTSSDSYLILSPTGAAAITFYNFSKYSCLETNAVPSNVISEIRNGSKYSFVVAPTQSGIQAINREIKENGSSDFLIAATITFGNFFVVSLNNDDDGVMNKGDSIVLFQQNGLPDLLFKKLYGELFTDDNIGNIHYVNAVSDTASIIKTGEYISEKGTKKANYVLSAEPVVTGAISTSVVSPKPSTYINIREKYQSLKIDNKITQASLFVNVKRINSDLFIDSFLEKYQKDITSGINDPSLITAGLKTFNNDIEVVKAMFGIPSLELLEKVMINNGLGLGFQKSFNIKSSIDNFITDIYPEMGVTDEKIYYK